MRKKINIPTMMRLAKAATILSLGGLAAGCSSDVIRFTDGFYTGAVPQAATASPQGRSDFGQPNYNPNVDQGYTGSVSSQQVQRTALPRPSDSKSPVPQPASPLAANQTYTAPANTSRVTTASIAPAPARFGEPATPTASAQTQPSAKATKGGWSTAGGTQVTMREGETIYNLARRYGVPADAIMASNGISDPKSVKSGQRIVIPTYVYSRSAGVSAPDRDPQTQAASATIGNRNTAEASSAPSPQSADARDSVIESGGRYTVVAGDTLSAISRRTGASVASIKQVNSMSSDVVRIGQKLIIPGLSADEGTKVASTAKVDKMTTSTVEPEQAADTTGGTKKAEDTKKTASAPTTTGVSAMRWPVQGRVVSAFGSNSGGKPNDGIDISVPTGTPVKAAENGIVIYAGDGLKELGKTILVRHSDGFVTVYGHVSDFKVKRGETIKRGQQIALSGMSGAAKQPQLHFEVRKSSKPVDPTKYLR